MAVELQGCIASEQECIELTINAIAKPDSHFKPYQQIPEVELLENPKYYLALTSLFSNEARFLKEWIEFHLMMGVEHFYLFNHNSNDNYLEVLQPYIEQQIVELSNIDHKPLNEADWYRSIQLPTYLNITNKVKKEVEWLMIIDSDEFFYPVKENNLTSVLKKYDQYASVSANWNVFGSKNITRVQDNELLIEKLTNHGQDNDFYVQNKHVKTVVKSIVKPRYVINYKTPHSPELLSGYKQINENYESFYGPSTPYKSNNIITVNHYCFRDWDFFYSNKLSRVHLINSHLSKDQKHKRISDLINLNKKLSLVPNDLILRFVDTLRAKVLNN